MCEIYCNLEKCTGMNTWGYVQYSNNVLFVQVNIIGKMALYSIWIFLLTCFFTILAYCKKLSPGKSKLDCSFSCLYIEKIYFSIYIITVVSV